MKSFSILASLVTAVIILAHCTGNDENKVSATDAIRQSVLATNLAFGKQLLELSQAVSQTAPDAAVQQSFQELRRLYKKMEWAVAYFMPGTARFTNGPALDEIEMEENTVLEAEGLQVLEEKIYPTVDTTERTEMQRMIKKLSNKSQSIDAYFEVNEITSSQLMDALRNQVFRITTLGITGFDTPVSGTALTEAQWSLESLSDVLVRSKDLLKQSAMVDTVCSHIAAAAHVLATATDRNEFNYLAFIQTHLNRISKDVLQLRVAAGIQPVAVTKAIRDDATTLFEENSFNPDAFVPGAEYKQTAARARLGKTLFSDNILSGDGSRSCASCHQASLAFSDGLKAATALKGAPLLRNTPSLSYSNFQHGQFWDMRRPDLETQAEDVISNKDEMHGSLKKIVAKLNTDSSYRAQFRTIYNTDSIANWQVQNVLAAYIRSLSGFQSNFDRYMRGDASAMNADQQAGFNVFVGKGKCATCHFIPLFNGTVPPEFTKTESEVLGIAKDFRNQQPDTDPGRGRFHGTVEQLQYAFKTPTLRNISKTAPYMHNGGYTTLQQVMEFYNEGGGAGLGFRVSNQTLPADKLNLTKREMELIIQFMETLSDQ
ncbi:MAG: cytochrome-c peroxidase [Pseudobacter sp.]|uniref:cytochrome-c peroxidase n=1 Tax=Pseudobacter sp. TaxID=2045420 RepID=UPI003F805FCC